MLSISRSIPFMPRLQKSLASLKIVALVGRGAGASRDKVLLPGCASLVLGKTVNSPTQACAANKYRAACRCAFSKFQMFRFLHWFRFLHPTRFYFLLRCNVQGPSQVQCLFCFEISTPEGREGEKGECKFPNKAHRTLASRNILSPVNVNLGLWKWDMDQFYLV